MSLKLVSFQTTNQYPKTQEKFYVYFSGLTIPTLKVCDCILPFEHQVTNEINIYGVKYRFPVAVEYDQEWSCSLIEDHQLRGLKTINNLEARIKPWCYHATDIHIFLTDQGTGSIPKLNCTLKNAYLSKVEPVQLDWKSATEVVRYRLTFTYSTVKLWL